MLAGVMARPLRIEYAGAAYPVTVCGNHRRAIFEGDADRRRISNNTANTIYLVRL
jgi:hypothetical protein